MAEKNIKARAVAQEQAKSGESSKVASGDGARGASLSERLADVHTEDAAQADSSAASSQDNPRLLPAQPASRRRIAANDDLPSIGGLIYALQQRPSRSPFVFAAIGSLAWLFAGGIAAWALLTQGTTGSLGDALQSPLALTAFATLLIPILLFWFLAILVWRAQDLRLMASAMTEVAVRLAEPDKLAEQSVASLGQTIRRQVAAMNDAISRALGRAGELEALVHNEVAALERSYGENEMRIRNLINELVSEREALANNSERVREALHGVSAKVTKQIAVASAEASQNFNLATSGAAETLTAKANKITAAISAAGTAIDNRLAERGARITERLSNTGKEVSQVLEARSASVLKSMTDVGDKLASDLPGILQKLDSEQKRLGMIMGQATQNFTALETAIAKRTSEFDKSLKDGSHNLNAMLADRIKALDVTVTEKTKALEHSIGERSKALEHSIGERSKALEHTLSERSKALEHSFSERSKALEHSLGQQANALQTSLGEQARTLQTTIGEQAKAIEQTLGKGSMTINQAMAESASNVRRLTELMNQSSLKARESLTGQAESLKDVSRGLLNQIHGLTQRFEKQGQAIVTAAQALDSSNSQIDSILERRHQEISALLDTVSNKAQSLDRMMRSYTGVIESSLAHVEGRARELSSALSQESAAQSRATIEEIERLRSETTAHTSSAIYELRNNFRQISDEVAAQLQTLTSQFGESTRQMRSSASQTAGEIETVRRELHTRMNELPEQTRRNAENLRRAVADQISALETLSSLGTERRELAPAPPALPPRAPAPQALSDNSQYGQRPAFTQQPAPRQSADLGSVTSHLARQLEQASQQPAAPPPAPRQQAPRQPSRAAPQSRDPGGRGNWSVGDLLARASEPDHQPGFGQQPPLGRPAAPPPSSHRGGELRLHDIASAIDDRTAAEIWEHIRRGEANRISPHMYGHQGQATFQEITRRYRGDAQFRTTVDRYMGDFERLLQDAEARGRGGEALQNYLTSETGRVYLMLAHASGRLN
ncbi:MAG: hypothetical protein AB7G34_10000 [Hyphomicrobiales bacterium]